MTLAPDLAGFADVERDGRARFYPRMVVDGEMGADDAQHDWRCWSAIAELAALERDGQAAVGGTYIGLAANFTLWGVRWDDLVAAAAGALARRDEALAQATDQTRQGLRARRDAVAAIHRRLQRTAGFYRQLNDDLRTAARRRAGKGRVEA